jgi:hypothetical protein
MIAAVYIKDGNIYFHNEKENLPDAGGGACKLGRSLLDFVCCKPERFDECSSMIAETFRNEYPHAGVGESEIKAKTNQIINNFNLNENYLFFYCRMFMEKEQRRFQTAKDAAAMMAEDIRQKQAFMANEIELLLNFREAVGAPEASSMEYIYWIESYRKEKTGHGFYLEKPFRSFYRALNPPEVVELYEPDTIDDLFRLEFIKMLERNIFIKKCKNCGQFFIPERRIDAEYCERIYGDGKRKCSEIGAMLRYERKVAGNPVLEAYSKAYKRLNSRTRAKKMTPGEFLNWSEQARKMRDECVAGNLPLDEFQAWLEQGRIRKGRGSGKQTPNTAK